jgi:hypothetical protein
LHQFGAQVADGSDILRFDVRQVKEDLWVLMARKPSDPKPGSMLDGDFRDHGRYVWYSAQLDGLGVAAQHRELLFRQF